MKPLVPEQMLRGEVLKELLKFQGDFTRVEVIKKSFNPNEGLPISKLRSVINYLNDKKYIEWDKKDVSRSDDDLIRITALGQDIVTELETDIGIII